MKKLTAGIFATILGVTAMGAADAAVTSKGYVDTAVATAKAAAIADAEKYIDATELKNSQDTQDASIKANADAIDAIEADYLKTADKTALQTNIDNVSAVANAAATQTALTTGLAGKQDLLQAGMFKKDGTGNVVTGITATDGQVTYTTTSVATSGELTALSGRVDTAEGNITTLQGDLGTVTVTANEASANATQALTNAATAQAAAEAAQSAADAAQQKADDNAGRIDNLGGTYVAITDYEQDTAAQEQINTQVNTSLESLANNKADKTELNNLATKTELNAKADQSALNDEATTRAQADAGLQAEIDAVEGGVEAITGATNGTEKGLYTLTKIVADDGTVSYGWELIDRDYAADDVTANGQ